VISSFKYTQAIKQLINNILCTQSIEANMSNTDSPPHTKEYPSTHDPENNIQPTENTEEKESSSAFKALGWLDRLLAVWILLAMIIGILLGNFVPSTGAALEKGKFVGVSVPIGKIPISN
jgi:ACR3 family arsenite transporter